MVHFSTSIKSTKKKDSNSEKTEKTIKLMQLLHGILDFYNTSDNNLQ